MHTTKNRPTDPSEVFAADFKRKFRRSRIFPVSATIGTDRSIFESLPPERRQWPVGGRPSWVLQRRSRDLTQLSPMAEHPVPSGATIRAQISRERSPSYQNPPNSQTCGRHEAAPDRDLTRAPRRRASSRLQVLPQELYKCLQRHGHLPPARIVKKDCCRGLPPVLQQGNQPPRVDLSSRITVSCVEHAHAVQRGFYGEFGIVDREAALYRYFHLPAILLKRRFGTAGTSADRGFRAGRHGGDVAARH